MLKSVRSLSATVGVVLAAGSLGVGCSGSDFSASPGGAGSGAAAGDSAAGSSPLSGGGSAGSASVGGADLGMAGASVGDAGGERDVPSGGAGGLGVGGTAGIGGIASTGGTAGGGGGGTGGTCNPIAWFPDADGDGFGRSSGQVTACTAPTNGTWVTKGGDCNDDNNAVFPGESDYKPEGYTTSGSTVSFDYDCSGNEDVDPTAEGVAPACTNVLACSGSGFQPTARTGPGVNALCGSKAHATCASGTLACMQVVTDVSAGVRCR